MATDTEKLKCISIGDVVSWRENSEEVSGPVNGFTLFRRDKLATHHVIVEREGQKEKTIALSSIIARRRERGAGSGIISWR